MIKDIFKTAGVFAVMYLMVDMLGALAWTVSGQMPAGGFYFGIVTLHIARVILRM